MFLVNPAALVLQRDFLFIVIYEPVITSEHWMGEPDLSNVISVIYDFFIKK
jgi:hypothetical protein